MRDEQLKGIGRLLSRHSFIKNMYPVNRQNRKVIFLRVTFRLGENHPIFMGTVVRFSITMETQGS